MGHTPEPAIAGRRPWQALRAPADEPRRVDPPRRGPEGVAPQRLTLDSAPATEATIEAQADAATAGDCPPDRCGSAGGGRVLSAVASSLRWSGS